MKVLVAYDGTLQAKDALRYGVQKVKENGGEVVALHVFNSNQYLDYDVFGAEEAGRAESARLVEDARNILKETAEGIRSRVIVEEGDPEEEIMRYARERNVDLLLCSPRHKAIVKSFRLLMGDQGSRITEDTILDETERPRLYVAAQR